MGHRVRDVVKFEIEKNPPSRSNEFADDGGALGREQLQADFIENRGLSDAPNHILRGARVGHVESYDQAVFHRRWRHGHVVIIRDAWPSEIRVKAKAKAFSPQRKIKRKIGNYFKESVDFVVT